MMDMYPNQPFYDPSFVNIPPNFIPGNEILINQRRRRNPRKIQKTKPPFSVANIPSLHLPAILLLAFSWLLHAIATFIPYWSTYSGIADSRAGLWSARNFNYLTIQNFYFPELTDFPNITDSIRFVTANTKGYLITVQFLMTFNFVVMLIVFVLLIIDYIFARRSVDGSRSFLISDHNTSDTTFKYGLLLYIIYVFGVFEFAAWITYVGSRHDNNWQMHVSFAFTVIVSVFLIVVFVMYVIEFIKRFTKNRLRWEYWYGPYIEWGFFVYLSALLLLLIVICCPEWGYAKVDSLNIFAEIGLFKQCYLSVIYKKTLSTGLCTLSDSRSNQSWVNATQAFMLMAYIIGIIILILIVIYRKEFLHNAAGYYADRVSQPTFTFVMAGLILFFGFIFSLIGVSVFGGEVFHHSIIVNWAYIVAVFAMVLFLIAGILFILDGVHSQRQTSATTSSSAQKFFFPAPLSSRVVSMQPLIKPEPPIQPVPQLQPWQINPLLGQQMSPFNFPQQSMYPMPNSGNTPFFSPEQMMMIPGNYGMEQYPFAPVAQAGLTNYFRQMQNNPQFSSLPYNQGLTNYFRQMQNNPQFSSLPYNQGLMNYSGDNPLGFPNNRNDIFNNNNNNLTDLVRLHFIQQQRLNYNHERLLERYNRLRTPRVAEFRTFGTSSLPGRNYDEYLQGMRGDDNLYGNSLAAMSRAGIGSSDQTYRWMGDRSAEPLPRGVSSVMRNNRDDLRPSVRAEKSESVKIYHHLIFGLIPAYIRQIYKKTKDWKSTDEESINEVISNSFGHKEERKTSATNDEDDDDGNEIFDQIPLRDISYANWKTTSDHLISVNPLLFDIYTQRLNGSIQSYGQSLYVPSGYHSHDRQPSHKDIFTSPPSDTGSVLADAFHEFPSSSKHRHHELHSQSASTTASHRLSEPFATANNGDLSGKETGRSDPPNAFSARNNSNLSTSSVSSASHISSPMPTTTTTPTQNTSTMNSAGLTPTSLSSNSPGFLNISPVSLTSESMSTSIAIIPYQTLSNTYNDSSTVVLIDSTQTSSNQRELVSLNNLPSLSPMDDVILNSSDNDSDDDNKMKHRRQKKKSTTTTDGNTDVNSSSSDD